MTRIGTSEQCIQKFQCACDICSGDPNGLYQPKSFFQEVIHVVSDLSFTVLREINILICFRVTLEHLQLLNKALGCMSDRGQLAMNMLNMARVFLYIFKFQMYRFSYLTLCKGVKCVLRNN